MPANNLLLISVSVIAILVLSTVFVAIPITPRASAQAQLPREQRNWEYINHDSLATNFNPQTQVGKANVHLLEMRWLFPIPPAATYARLQPGIGVTEGAMTPPIVVDGIVYIATNQRHVVALDAKTGKQIWINTRELNGTKARIDLPLAPITGHTHAIYYIDGLLYMTGFDCRIIAIDALTGKTSFEITNICKDIPGNIYPPSGMTAYSSGGVGGYRSGNPSHPPVVYKKGNVVIWEIGGRGGDAGFGGRAAVVGFDLTTKQLLWRFFLRPPAEGDPEWALRYCDRGWIQGIRCTSIPREYLRNDWINPNRGTPYFGMVHPTNAVSNVWGQMAVDEETGIVYMGIAQNHPDWNATYRPGPNLYSNTILALNAKTGEPIWWYQTVAHDLWDSDNSWNTILGKIGDRKVVFKGVKNGIVYALDAATGAKIWIFNSPAIKRSDYQVFWAGSKICAGPGVCGPADNSEIGNWDPRNSRIYTLPWQSYGTPDQNRPFWLNPPGTGGIESDMAYAYGNIYVAARNDPAYGRIVEPHISAGRQAVSQPFEPSRNGTLHAVDAATGREKWSFFMENSPYRGGVMVSGGVVYLHTPSGILYGLDADTGKVLMARNFGTGLLIQPTIGATADGKMQLFLLFGGSATIGGLTAVPGALVAFGLPDKLPEPQVITKEVIKEVPKEVVKEVVKEVTKEVVKEVPKEVIKEVPKEVVRTETKTVTVETISPISYAAIGIAVVLVVVAGVLFTRRKKA